MCQTTITTSRRRILRGTTPCQRLRGTSTSNLMGATIFSNATRVKDTTTAVMRMIICSHESLYHKEQEEPYLDVLGRNYKGDAGYKGAEHDAGYKGADNDAGYKGAGHDAGYKQGAFQDASSKPGGGLEQGGVLDASSNPGEGHDAGAGGFTNVMGYARLFALDVPKEE